MHHNDVTMVLIVGRQCHEYPKEFELQTLNGEPTCGHLQF